METQQSAWSDAPASSMERPSEEFVRAVADLLETDAEDMLVELGYVYREAVVADTASAKMRPN